MFLCMACLLFGEEEPSPAFFFQGSLLCQRKTNNNNIKKKKKYFFRSPLGKNMGTTLDQPNLENALVSFYLVYTTYSFGVFP